LKLASGSLDDFCDFWKTYEEGSKSINNSCHYLNRHLRELNLANQDLEANAYLIWQSDVLLALKRNNNALICRIMEAVERNRDGQETPDHWIRACIYSFGKNPRIF
jgi:hypothetical protein